ncbi:mycofactocin system GMC family oxidoreductase MftG [Rhodococcus sp. G-MC3]|uniref:mycofactocin dehydrogenase MftG n=1 Tax=Rhodococcus sp. G-MC3 TaxID=3046209 RepID=UPI0024B9FF03|nr:mycofactocin system GMC family oxidoreductase MftG [Rhodococcus sp. G-MC3]MDJ0392801.1 mycofactocin system GMC family oxidoreductase MftG [Rhodococcus sp. G-MC3]
MTSEYPGVPRSTVDHADIVVVGGGSAGCVLATRLSEDASCNVLLIESGPGFTGLGDWPAEIADAHVLPVGPGSPWTASYPASLTTNIERTISRGHVLGGSGSVNGGYFVRARPRDFDAWPASWSHRNVLPYFCAAETDHDFSGEWHGRGGPIDVARVPDSEQAEVSRAFFSAAMECGFAHVADLNDPADGDGVGPVPLNVFGGKRINTAVAYLLPNLNRDNLTMMTETVVLSVIFDSMRAVGVEVLRHGGVSRIRAETVVLCAGAVRTPQLLMLSGIGPADALNDAGVPVVLDHPNVGQGFSDHPEIGVYYRSSFGHLPASPLEVVLHTGDLEIRPFAAPFDRMISGLAIGDPMIGVGLMRPNSRGEIVLRSSDPLESPMVRYRYLESASDRAALRYGLDIVSELFASSPLCDARAVDVTVDPLSMHLGTSLHLSGSASMGEGDSVLDDRCRVRGIDGLVVADTSAFPVVPSRGPHATAIMLAERVSDLIRKA